MELIITLIIAAGLAFIPANIASKKGRSFGLWWVYGWLLFIVALIHSLCLKDESNNTPVNNSSVNSLPETDGPVIVVENPDVAKRDSVDSTDVKYATEAMVQKPVSETLEPKKTTAEDLDLLLKYKELLDGGVITQEDFEKKKKELL